MSLEGASVCEVLGEHLTPIPVVDERLELLGYVCGGCGVQAGRDRVMPPPGAQAAGVALELPSRAPERCHACGGALPRHAYLVPLPGEDCLSFPLVGACSVRCVARVLGFDLPDSEPDRAAPGLTVEAWEAWRRWLEDPANRYEGPPIPLDLELPEEP